MKKTLKGWAVVWKYNGEIHDTRNYFQVHGRTLRIFPVKKDALEYKIEGQIVVPCTISYSIPSKKK